MELEDPEMGKGSKLKQKNKYPERKTSINGRRKGEEGERDRNILTVEA